MPLPSPKLITTNYKIYKHQVPLCSAGKCIQHSINSHNGKEYDKVCVYIHTYVYIHSQLSHFALHYKNIVNQLCAVQ